MRSFIKIFCGRIVLSKSLWKIFCIRRTSINECIRSFDVVFWSLFHSLFMGRKHYRQIPYISKFSSSLAIFSYWTSKTSILSVRLCNSIKSTWLIVWIIFTKVSLCEVPFWVKWADWPFSHSHGFFFSITERNLPNIIILTILSLSKHQIHSSVFWKHCEIIFIIAFHTMRKSFLCHWALVVLSLFKLDPITFNNCWDCMILRLCFFVYFIIYWVHKGLFLIRLIIFIIH